MKFTTGLIAFAFACPLATAWAASDEELTTVETSVAPAAESLYKSEESGAYLGFEAKTTSISDSEARNYGAVLLGLRGAWRLNQDLALGGAVYHVMNDLTTPTNPLQENSPFQDNRFGMTYGGIFAEYTYESWRLIHPAASVLVGAGSASMDPRDATAGGSPSSQLFYVLEPQLSGIVNLSPAVHAGINVSYRIARAMTSELDALSSHRLSGLSGGLFLQAGWF